MQEPFVIEETKDASRIRALASQCYMEAYKEIHTEEQNRFSFEEMYSLDSLHRQMEVLHSRFFIITGECDMAYVSFYPLEGTRWMLDKLYVHPQYNGRGYGKRLVNHVWQEIASATDVSFEIVLKVNRRNAAVSFYKHLGFKITGEWDVSIADGKWVMDGYDMACKYNQKILVSACLLGENCKYNGGNNRCQKVIDFVHGQKPIPVCPEQLGGLPTPRIPAEICNGRVTTKEGVDVDHEFRKGAEVALKIAKDNAVELAILQPRSPSCGCKEIYDGSFSKTLIDGSGVFAQLLKENGIRTLEPADLENSF